MQTYDVNLVDPDRRALIEAADQAVQRLSRGPSFHEWMRIGIGVNEMERAAQQLAGSQNIQSYAYRQAWRALAALYPHVAELNKSERSLASWMATNREAVESWHARLDDRKRRDLNTPRAIYNNHPLGRATREAQRQVRPPKQAPATKSDLTETTNAIIDEVTRIGGSVAPYDLSTPEMISAAAETCTAQYGPIVALRFAAALADANGAAAPSEPEALYCDFCGKPSDEANRMVRGRSAAICDGCVAQLWQTLAEQDDTPPPPKPRRRKAAKAPEQPITTPEPDSNADGEKIAAMRADLDAGMPLAKITRKYGFRYVTEVKGALGLPA